MPTESTGTDREKLIAADPDFKDDVVEEVRRFDEGDWKGHEITLKSSWCYHIDDKDWPKPIKVGDTIRLYGGWNIRGIAINGEIAFYRTEAEQKVWSDEMLYGKNIDEWLKRWDEGRSVWTIEMGGIGPGYEQCLQILVIEMVRWLNVNKPTEDKLSSKWTEICNDMDVALKDVEDKLRPSGSQWGAARGLAHAFYSKGPVAILTDKQAEDRKIQISKDWPHYP